jgi:metal-responsive CopG/Arc/MetJ family transcriptional regulator
MTRPTTIRLPEDLLSEIDQFVKEAKLDRSVYLREILKKGFSLDKQERVLQKYMAGELSQVEVCKALEWNLWQFVEELRTRNLHLNVNLENFLNSSRLPGK